jgi:uncharacterized protein YdhG (YjbR/CyaY superfamily)
VTRFHTVEDYLDSLPPPTRTLLDQISERVHGVVPAAAEVISYDIPTFTVDGRRFMHVAAWKRHLSVYPAPSSDPVLTAELAPYAAGKGTLKFALDQPMPWGLLERVAVTLAAESRPAG